jgi:predicted nucleic acid-binding protein
MTPVVIDNTVLSNFAHIQQPSLLGKAFETPVTVRAVIEEWHVGVQSARVPSADWGWIPLIELTPAEQVFAEQLGKTLGRGESACIALAQSRRWIVLTDDRDARRMARQGGITISGTLGALKNLVRGHVLSLTEADVFLTMMKQHGYRCPVNSLSELDNG